MPVQISETIADGKDPVIHGYLNRSLRVMGFSGLGAFHWDEDTRVITHFSRDDHTKTRFEVDGNPHITAPLTDPFGWDKFATEENRRERVFHFDYTEESLSHLDSS